MLKSITFDGKMPLELVESSNTYIKVRIDASHPGVGNIVIISNTFAEVALENGWTYDVQSDITEVCVLGFRSGLTIIFYNHTPTLCMDGKENSQRVVGGRR